MWKRLAQYQPVGLTAMQQGPNIVRAKKIMWKSKLYFADLVQPAHGGLVKLDRKTGQIDL